MSGRKFGYSHTTLAQDAMNLYFAVIDETLVRLRQDLEKHGKSQAEVEALVKRLEQKWKQNLTQTNCIDKEHLMGIGLDEELQYGVSSPIVSYDNRTRQRGGSPGPKYIHSTYPKGNPLTSGDGVPTLEQVRNPFVNENVSAVSRFEQQKHSEVSAMQTLMSGHRIPQTDGGCDEYPPAKRAKPNSIKIPQLDGPADDGQGSTSSAAAIPTDQNPSSANKTFSVSDAQADGERPLCSDDDASSDEPIETNDALICQYTKVSRKKNDWSVDLKDCVMHINGKDYAFATAVGGKFRWLY